MLPTLFRDDLEVQKFAHAQNKTFPICIIKDDKKFSFNFYRNENHFFARYTLLSHELESYSNRPEIINILPLNSLYCKLENPRWPIVVFLFLFSIYSKTEVHRDIPILLIFAPKHRLWVLIRAPSPRRF